MTRYMIGVIVALVIAVAGVGWLYTQQAVTVGKLSSEAEQYEASLDAMRSALLDQHQRQIDTDKRLAQSRIDSQSISRRASQLEHDLQLQNDECLNAVISDATVKRVLEFQAD